MPSSCPNGHDVRPARGPSCMVNSGYYWCGRCISEPPMRAMSGGPMMGMYYSKSQITRRDAGDTTRTDPQDLPGNIV